VLEVREVPSPKSINGQVHVRVRAAALNPKDVLVRKGKFKLFTGRRFPLGVGYDFAGTVLAGARFEKGTQVFGMINGWRGRTVAEELMCGDDECQPMPEIDFVAAAGIPLAGQTALQALRDLGRVGPGSAVLINGASGGVGTLAIQIAQALGARVTTVSSVRNIEHCRDLGAVDTVDYQQVDPLAADSTYDVIFDVFGNRSYSAARRSLRRGGIYITTVPSARGFFDQIRTRFSRHSRAAVVIVQSRAADLASLGAWVTRGLVRPVVDRVYELEEIADAQRYLETRRARGKVAIRL